MAMIHTFEDIEAWQKARQLSKMVYKYTKFDAFKKDYGLCDQIRRAAVSVMSNIAEWFDRSGNKEFVQFLFIAKGSTAEIESQLYVALDNGYINKEQFMEATSLTFAVKSLLSGFIRYLKKSDMKEYKFKNLKSWTPNSEHQTLNIKCWTSSLERNYEKLVSHSYQAETRIRRKRQSGKAELFCLSTHGLCQEKT